MIRKRWLAAAAYSGMFGFGIVMAILGAILPLLAKRIGFDLAQAGTLFLAMNGMMLVGTLAIGPLLDRFGMKPPLLIGPALMAAALLLIARAENYSALLTSVMVLGLGGAALNSTTNALIADLHVDPRRKNAALNLLGVFFGFGALFIPFTISVLIGSLGLRRILYAAMVLASVTAAVALMQRFPAAKQGSGLNRGDIGELARHPLVLSYAFLLFFESGNEFILGGFISVYLTGHLGLTVGAASIVLAAYWGAIMAARIILSRILLVVRGELLIALSAAGTMVSGGLMLGARGQVQALIAVILLGFSIAAIFPTTLGLAAARFERYSGSVFGILISVALAGGMTLPWVVGHLAAAFSLQTALLVVVVDAACIAVLLSLSRRAAARR